MMGGAAPQATKGHHNHTQPTQPLPGPETAAESLEFYLCSSFVS